MHWRTYERIRTDALVLEKEILSETVSWMSAVYGFRRGSKTPLKEKA